MHIHVNAHPCWCTSLSFSAHWFLAPHGTQPVILYRTYLESESELECMPRQPDHLRNYPLRDPKKFPPTVCLRVILHWLFLRRSRWEKAEKISLSHPYLHLEQVRKAFIQNNTTLKSFIDQLNEWDDFQLIARLFRANYNRQKYPLSLVISLSNPSSNLSVFLRVPTLHWIRGQMAPKDVGKSTLIISALKASMPVALTFFKDLMVFATSLTVGVFTLISRSLEAQARVQLCSVDKADLKHLWSTRPTSKIITVQKLSLCKNYLLS